MKHLSNTRRRRQHLRRGQGMTEYIIIVGLVAVALITAVNQYSFRVDEAIQGTTGAMNNRVTGQMTGGGNPPPQPPAGAPQQLGTLANGTPVMGVRQGNTWTNRTVNGQPYDPAVHGPIQ